MGGGLLLHLRHHLGAAGVDVVHELLVVHHAIKRLFERGLFSEHHLLAVLGLGLGILGNVIGVGRAGEDGLDVLPAHGRSMRHRDVVLTLDEFVRLGDEVEILLHDPLPLAGEEREDLLGRVATAVLDLRALGPVPQRGRGDLVAGADVLDRRPLGVTEQCGATGLDRLCLGCGHVGR